VHFTYLGDRFSANEHWRTRRRRLLKYCRMRSKQDGERDSIQLAAQPSIKRNGIFGFRQSLPENHMPVQVQSTICFTSYGSIVHRNCTTTFAWSSKAGCFPGQFPKAHRWIHRSSDWRCRWSIILSSTENLKASYRKERRTTRQRQQRPQRVRITSAFRIHLLCSPKGSRHHRSEVNGKASSEVGG
jgi:hypothetical protein